MNSLFDDIKATLFSIWRRRWIALGVAWLVCLAGWGMVSTIPNTYESHARIMVQLYDPLAAQVGIDASDRKRDVDRVRDTLTSSANLEKVIRGTRLGDNITDRKQMEGMIAGLSKSIKIVATQDNIFEISAQSRSGGGMSDADGAHLAQDIVRKVIDIFGDENNDTKQGEMKQTLDFLDQQLVNRQGELQAAEQRRLTFETQHPELAQGGVSTIQQMEQNRAEMRGLDGDIAAAQSALAAVNGQMAGVAPTVAGAAAPGQLGGTRAQLAQLQSDLVGMRARGMTDNHPDVIAARNQIVALKAQIRAEGPTPVAGPGAQPNPAYTTLESIRVERQANLQALQARRTTIEQAIATQTARQLSNPELAQEAQNISRDYDILKAQYDKLLQDREELRLRGQVVAAHGATKFQVLDPPVLPHGASAPNRPLLLMVVLVAGIGAGLGVAFALGELQSSFATTAKLERVTGLPVLGAISQSLSETARAERARGLRGFIAASGALGGLFMLLVMMERFNIGGGA
ncbi:XrtA system polysaccharide chain length determinant [Novosphingobium terrae]|uniref:XrtA system polysaccharide chain length determinant n=1 Tax=Novosphingobium terrae TaxID=2726189 RepID=UPI001981F246|nr:XrtA system polysaccharide chain length determinant [Novosphingobium terrae]